MEFSYPDCMFTNNWPRDLRLLINAQLIAQGCYYLTLTFKLTHISFLPSATWLMLITSFSTHSASLASGWHLLWHHPSPSHHFPNFIVPPIIPAWIPVNQLFIKAIQVKCLYSVQKDYSTAELWNPRQCIQPFYICSISPMLSIFPSRKIST